MIKISLQKFGDVYFEKNEGPETIYRAVIEDCRVEDNSVCLNINSYSLNEHTVEKIDTILNQLDKMNTAARKAYLDDFNDEEEDIYTSGIYKKILNVIEFEQLKQSTGSEQRLLFALNLALIDINLKKQSASTVFKYIKGYELELNFKFNENCELKELIFQPGTFIGKKQLSDFIDKWEQPGVGKICSRFRGDWWNYPVKSYFIYLMAQRISNYLKNKTS